MVRRRSSVTNDALLGAPPAGDVASAPARASSGLGAERGRAPDDTGCRAGSGPRGAEQILKALEEMTALPRIYFAVQRSRPSDPAVQVRVLPSLAVPVLPSKSLLQN